jgi:acetyl esterase
MPLHPQARAFLDVLAAQKGRGWEEMTPAEAREVFNGLTQVFGTGPELVGVENQVIDGRVPVRLFRPANGKALPVVMFFHGGGWVLGNLDTHDTLCRRLAKASGCIVVSVGYRLAPERRFPAALDDCFDAAVYVAEHADSLGIDARRLAVCGDSAGGNLAAAVALRARERGTLRVHSQWLIYPVLEAWFDTESYRAFGEGYGLTRAAMQWFWDCYAPTAADRANPLAAPLLAKSLGGLPPVQVITAEYDVLRDEGEAFAAKLKAAGVPTTLRRHDGMLHGFLHFSEPFDDAKAALAELGAAMKGSLMP